MRRPRPGVGSELVPVALILVGLAGTFALVVSMHRRATPPRPAAAPPVVVAIAPPAEPVEEAPAPDHAPASAPPPPPVAAVVQPPPEDPTKKALARLESQEAEEARAAREADRKAVSLETARQAAVAEAQRWQRRESLVRGQLDALAAQAGAIEQEADKLAEERDVLARERDASKAALAKARSRNGGYAVLPSKGANGTWQRPVVIECRDGVAILQPRGQRFTLMEMSGLLGPRSSPLTGAVAGELLRVQRATAPDGESVVPYIYFVVRPDGIRSFYEARGRLEPLGIAFGYELVDQDWEVDFPDFDDLVAWDGSNRPRPKKGEIGSAGMASGGSRSDTDGGGFVWPVDRADRHAATGGGRRGDGSDTLLWPTHPPGEAPGGVEGHEIAGAAGGRGANGRGVPGAGAGGAPPSLGNLDVPRLLGEGEAVARDGLGAGRVSRIRPGRDSSELVPLGAGGLPGLDAPGLRALPGPDAGTGRPGSVAGISPEPGDSAGQAPSGGPSTASGEPNRPTFGIPSGGSRGPAAVAEGVAAARDAAPPTARSNPPLHPGRVPIEPSLLAEATDDDPFAGSRDPSSSASSKPGARGATGSPTGGVGQPSSTGGPEGMAGVGMPGLGSAPSGRPKGDFRPRASTGSAARSDSKERIEMPLDLTVACGPDGVVIHPGGYRLSRVALTRDGTLRRDLQTIVRNHELIDPAVRPRPRVRFLVEPGGTDTYWQARRQTVLSGLSWPVTIQVAGAQAPRVFPKERF